MASYLAACRASPVQELLPRYNFGFRSSPQENEHPEEGRHEGLVLRNDALTSVFI